MKAVTFSQVPIGAEFMWGSYYETDMNWGRKRSSKTADWSPRIMGKLSEHITWGYFGQHERVYLTS